MLGFRKEQPARDERAGQVEDDGKCGGGQAGGKQRKRNRRQDRGEQHGDDAEAGRVLPAHDMDHLGRQVVRPGMRRGEAADVADGPAANPLLSGARAVGSVIADVPKTMVYRV